MTNKNNKRRKPNTTNTGSDYSAHSQSDSVTRIGLDKADIQKLISDAINEAVFSISEKLDYALEHLKGQQILVTSLLNKLRDKDNIITELEQKIDLMRQDMEFELNDFEQYGVNNSIRIYNLAIKNNDSTSTVLKLLIDKLEIQLSASDIVAAHPLPQSISSSNRDPRPPPPILVKKIMSTTKGLVIQNRRELKGNTSKISIHEDLTRKNMLLLNRVKRDDRISAAWSSRGLIWCILKNSNVKFNVRLFVTNDGDLSRSNSGAQCKSRLTQQARGATTTDSIATRYITRDFLHSIVTNCIDNSQQARCFRPVAVQCWASIEPTSGEHKLLLFFIW